MATARKTSAKRRKPAAKFVPVPRKRASAKKPVRHTARVARFPVIDFHCHMRVPEVVAFCKGHGPDASVPDHPNYTEAARRLDAEWSQAHRMRTGDMPTRLKLMDEQGVDIQVLSPSGISQYTLWAEPEESLKWERRLNEDMAEMVASVPGRFIGLGSVPLHCRCH